MATVLLAGVTLSLMVGCERAWLNGFLDPTQVGRFEQAAKKREIRRTLGLLIDEPEVGPGTTEPTSEDLVPQYVEAVIGPSDVVQVTILELFAPESEFKTEPLLVNELGYVTLPEIGLVKFAGRTATEARLDVMAKLIDAGKLLNPQVTVTLLQSQQKRYTVIGSVARPGIYPISRPDFRLMDAVADSGGVPPLLKSLFIIRTVERKRSSATPEEPPPPNPAQAPPLRGGDEGGAPAPATSSRPARANEFHLAAAASDPPAASRGRDPSASSPASTSPHPPFERGGMGGSSPPSRTALPTPPTPPSEGGARGGSSMPSIKPLLPPPASAPAPSADELQSAFERPNEPTPPYIYDESRKEWVPVAPQPAHPPSPPLAKGGKGGVFDAASQPTRVATTSGTRPTTARGSEPASERAPIDWEALTGGETMTRVIEIPIEPLLAGDRRYNIVIRSNDIVNVAPGVVGEFYIMGNVARPGAFQLSGHEITIREAIAASGGFGPLATPSRTELTRRGRSDEEETRPIDLDAIFAGRADNFYIRPNDIINVGTNPLMPFIATLRNAFRVSYGFGGVYDRNFADIDSFSGQQNPTERRRAQRLQRGFPL